MNPACPACGLRIEASTGAFLGPFVINYAVTAFLFVIPVVAAFAAGKIGTTVAIAGAGGAALVVPILFYRLSWGWWLGLYYFFFPQNLPANLSGTPDDE